MNDQAASQIQQDADICLGFVPVRAAATDRRRPKAQVTVVGRTAAPLSEHTQAQAQSAEEDSSVSLADAAASSPLELEAVRQSEIAAAAAAAAAAIVAAPVATWTGTPAPPHFALRSAFPELFTSAVTPEPGFKDVVGAPGDAARAAVADADADCDAYLHPRAYCDSDRTLPADGPRRGKCGCRHNGSLRHLVHDTLQPLAAARTAARTDVMALTGSGVSAVWWTGASVPTAPLQPLQPPTALVQEPGRQREGLADANIELPLCTQWLQEGACSDRDSCLYFHPRRTRMSGGAGGAGDHVVLPPAAVPAPEILVLWDTENCSMHYSHAAAAAASSGNPSAAAAAAAAEADDTRAVVASLTAMARVVAGAPAAAHVRVAAFHRRNLTAVQLRHLPVCGSHATTLPVDCGLKPDAVDSKLKSAVLMLTTQRLMVTATASTSSSSASTAQSADAALDALLVTDACRPLWVFLVSGDSDFTGELRALARMRAGTCVVHGPDVRRQYRSQAVMSLGWQLVLSHASHCVKVWNSQRSKGGGGSSSDANARS